MQSQKTASNLKQYSYLHYEQLKHVGMSSVRVINGRVERLTATEVERTATYCILFHELEDGIEISLIEIDETHYGQR